VWSWVHLHGSTDSFSLEMRLHQYVRLYPAPEAGLPYNYEEYDRYACTSVLQRSLRKGILTQEQIDAALPDAPRRELFGLLPSA
jgi:hypothetical protein